MWLVASMALSFTLHFVILHVEVLAVCLNTVDAVSFAMLNWNARVLMSMFVAFADCVPGDTPDR